MSESAQDARGDERVEAAAKVLYECDLMHDRVSPGVWANLRPYYEADAVKVLAAADRAAPLPQQPHDCDAFDQRLHRAIEAAKTFREAVPDAADDMLAVRTVVVLEPDAANPAPAPLPQPAMMDNAKATVTATDINDQRAKGWPDFDPEDYCHRCGRLNVRSWFVSSPLWNAAEIENDTPSGIICPPCFVAAFETTENGHASWELRPDPLTMHNMNPALREANDEWLASYQSSRGEVGQDERITAAAKAMRYGDDERGMMSADERWHDRALVALASLDAVEAREVAALTAECERLRVLLRRFEGEHERQMLAVIDERDRAQDVADQLAYAIAPQVVIGEHSSMNDPWKNALEIAEARLVSESVPAAQKEK